MKKVLLCCLTAVVFILPVCSKGIHGRLGGSKMCPDLSLQSLPVVSSKYLQLHILSGRSVNSLNSLLHCRVVSVKFLPGSGGESLSKYSLSQWFAKKDNNILKLAVRNQLQQLSFDAKVIVELNCKSKTCLLSSFVNKQANNKQKRFNRKLLSLKSNAKMNNDQGSIKMLAVWLAVGTVLTLIVVLAMCACHKNDVEKALSDEVGGTEFNQQVIGVSSIDKPQQESQSAETTNTANSSNNIKTISNQEQNSTRTVSQSSHQHEVTVERTSYVESSVNQSSEKVEKTTALKSESEENKKRIRSQSTKEKTSNPSEPVDLKGFSQSDTFMYKGNEANIATPSQGRKQPVQLISRKDSDKKENKDHDDGNQKGKRSWLRRKSSKTKSTSEKSTSKADKKTNSRHSDLPLPPTPESKDAPTFIQEENQYESVETRPKRVEKKAESSRLSKGQSSELYASIDDEDKAKRNSSGSHMYDVVETKAKPPKDNTSGLEYAYTVVAPKDNPIQPSQTSSGSGLYEVVTDDMKKNIPLVQVDDDYAIVQKDPSKKKSSTQATRPLSDTDLAPAPPPVTDMPSAKRRTQSEGENLNVLTNEPTSLSEPKKEVEHTYAKVNKLRKTSHPEKANVTRNAESILTEGVDDESEEPPPIPPSLYAELPVKGDKELVSSDEHQESMATIMVDSMATDTNEIITNSTKTVVVKSETHIQRNSLSEVKIMCEDATQESKGLQDSLDREKPVKKSAPSPNPLYDEIHYV